MGIDNSKSIETCVLNYTNGDKYEGEILNGQREGKGTYFYHNGDKYQGIWSQNKKHGMGTMFYKDGNMYVGQWKNSEKEGIGVFYSKNGDKYEGEYKNGKKHGNGKLTSPDGTTYQGSFNENKKHGEGYVFFNHINKLDNSNNNINYFYNNKIKKTNCNSLENKKYYKELWDTGIIKSCKLVSSKSDKEQFEKSNNNFKHISQQNELIKNAISLNINNNSNITPIYNYNKERYLEDNFIFNNKENINNYNNNNSYNNLSKQNINESFESYLNQQVMSNGKMTAISLAKYFQVKIPNNYFDALYFLNLTSELIYQNPTATDWNGNEVAMFVKSIGLDNYSKYDSIFRDMNGVEFIKLTILDLINLGINDHKNIQLILKSLDFLRIYVKMKFNYEEFFCSTGVEEDKFLNIDNCKESTILGEKENILNNDNNKSKNTTNENKQKLHHSNSTMSRSDSFGNNIFRKILFRKSSYKKSPIYQSKKLTNSNASNLSNLFNSVNNNLKKNKNLDILKDNNKEIVETNNEDSIEEDKSNKNSNINTNDNSNDYINKNKGISYISCKLDKINNDNTSKNCNDIINTENNEDKKIETEESNNHLIKKENNNTLAATNKSELKDISDDDNYLLNNDDDFYIADTQEYIITKIAMTKLIIHSLHLTGFNFYIDFNELTFIDKIGEGGFGVVYSGYWSGKLVAIKKFHLKEKYSIKSIFTKFLKEINTISNLRHPNIVLYMGASVNNKDCYLISEYISKGSLFDFLHISKSSISNEHDQIRIAYEIAVAVKYLHSRKILHCDLKSSNILLDDNYKIKISDFGLSKIKTIINESDNKKGSRLGTPHWMSPEIMKKNIYEEASDIYSYGMIVWEILTKKVPYYGMTPNQIIGQVSDFKKIVDIPNSGNYSLRKLIRYCLAYNPQDRPSFDIIIKYLENVLNKCINHDYLSEEIFNFVS